LTNIKAIYPGEEGKIQNF